MSRIKIFVSRDWAPIRLGTLTRALSFLLVLAVLIMAGALSQAQSNFTIIHYFTGPDGDGPNSTPTLDSQGNLYGTTWGGGDQCGNVYELEHVNGSWIMHPRYTFTGQLDGCEPFGAVTIGPDGTLFGTTEIRGAGGHGTLFNVRPPAHAVCATPFCPGTDTTLHSFAGSPSDGAESLAGVVFDLQGNLYGTTYSGGTYGGGTVYEATRSGSTWNVSVIHSFGSPDNDGNRPYAGVVLDSAGNIYGTTMLGGVYTCGTVFELTPSEGGWTETLLHSFPGGADGCAPQAGLVFDRAGNLYGATYYGTIFELSRQGGGWNFTTIYTFPENGAGSGPASSLAIDAAGNLYGANVVGGTYNYGNVWELSPSSGGGWTYTDLYDFTRHGDDGAYPYAGVAVTGPGGYLYGTAGRGARNRGIIYQINLGAH